MHAERSSPVRSQADVHAFSWLRTAFVWRCASRTLIRLLSLVGRKRATLSVGQLSPFQFGHPTVSARVEGEVSRESNVLPQLLDKMLNRRTCIELRAAIVQRVKRFAKHARVVISREPVSFSLS